MINYSIGGGTETATNDSSPADSFQPHRRDALHEYGINVLAYFIKVVIIEKLLIKKSKGKVKSRYVFDNPTTLG